MTYSEIEDVVTSAPKTVLTPVQVGVKVVGKFAGNLLANVVKVPVSLAVGIYEGIVEKKENVVGESK